MSRNDDNETHESDDDVPDQVNHQLNLGIILFKHRNVREYEGEDEIASSDGDGRGVFLEVTNGIA